MLSLQASFTRKKGKMRRREPAVNWYIGIRRGGHIGTLIGCLISTLTHQHISTLILQPTLPISLHNE